MTCAKHNNQTQTTKKKVERWTFQDVEQLFSYTYLQESFPYIDSASESIWSHNLVANRDQHTV